MQWGPPSYFSSFLIALLIGLFHLQSMSHLKKEINGPVSALIPFLPVNDGRNLKYQVWGPVDRHNFHNTKPRSQTDKEATANLKQPLPLPLSAVEATSPQDLLIFIGQMDFSVLKRGRQLKCSFKFFPLC